MSDLAPLAPVDRASLDIDIRLRELYEIAFEEDGIAAAVEAELPDVPIREFVYVIARAAFGHGYADALRESEEGRLAFFVDNGYDENGGDCSPSDIPDV